MSIEPEKKDYFSERIGPLSLCGALFGRSLNTSKSNNGITEQKWSFRTRVRRNNATVPSPTDRPQADAPFPFDVI